jgi:acyl-CoA synthetase (NDP forming)
MYAGYYGDNALERARADMVVDCVEDLTAAAIAIYKEQDKEKQVLHS